MPHADPATEEEHTPGPPRRVAHLPPAAKHIEDLAPPHRRLALFVDFDGTLAPIVQRPQDAVVLPQARAALARVAAFLPVGVVSGRALDDVKARVGLDDIWYAGSHGLEMQSPDGERSLPPGVERSMPAVRRAAAALGGAVAAVPGALLERKPLSVAVHYRLVPPGGEGAVVAAVREVAAREPELRITEGRRVLELRPALAWDKGQAVRAILTTLADGERLHPLMIGDDITDEDAFRAVDRAEGTAIVVAAHDRATWARYAVADPHEVAALLDALAARVGHGA